MRAYAPRTFGYAAGLDVVEASLDLMDIWRERHPGQAAFTHVATNGQSAARLDRWLLSTPIAEWCTQADFVLGLPGDHLGVSAVLSPPASVCRGPGPWSFPLPLLHDARFCEELKLAMTDHLHDRLHDPTFTHAMRWDGLKCFVRDYAQQYSFKAGQQRRARQRVLEGVAHRAMAAASATQRDPSALLAFQQAQATLQEYHVQASKLSALRAGVTWQHYGEQSTFYFYHLSRSRARATEIRQLRYSDSADPITLSGLAECRTAGEHFASAFSSDSPSGLFAEHPTDATAQQALLNSISRRLPIEARHICEGLPNQGLSAAELTSSLQLLARGKRPGSDGLPYEFYMAFWEVLAAPLLSVFEEAFAGHQSHTLPASMRTGLIVLLYKGAGNRDEVANYRPITLLNADYKIIAKALACRFGGQLGAVIDPTQTAFLPSRWIGDNVLCHMEEIDFLQASQDPGCILLLDFAKAYDRLDRHWLLQCMQALGFGPQAIRCAQLMQADTQGCVLFNGWRSPMFPVRSGIPQGSPLSPLLYVIAAQPLSSMLAAQASAGLFQCIRLPDGSAAPPCHQHADDTSLHVRTRQDAAIALDGPVALFCAASGSAVNRAKSQGLLFGSEAAFEGLDASLGVTFASHAAQVKHLGIYIGHDSVACSHRMYDRLIEGLRLRVGHWSARRLSFLGRVHVAKQVLGASLWYHATFVRPSADQMATIVALIMAFVGGADPQSGQARPLFPNRTLSSLEWGKGGVRLI